MRVFTLSIMYSLLVLSMLYGEVTIGADVVSRYVWRGTDYGNAASVQPSIETVVGPVTVGAWGSYSLSPGFLSSDTTYDASGSECDLYASFSAGPIGITITDYFFPAGVEGDGLFELSGDKATHVFELSAGADLGPVSLLAAANVSGDFDANDESRNSAYLELTYGALSLGLGNGLYSNDGEFAPVSFGISASRDNLSASYIINPDKETSFLVFGVNF